MKDRGIEFSEYCNKNKLRSIKNPAKRAKVIAAYPGFGDGNYWDDSEEVSNAHSIQRFLKENADWDNFPNEYIKLADHMGAGGFGKALNSLFLKEEESYYRNSPDWGRLYDENGYLWQRLKERFPGEELPDDRYSQFTPEQAQARQEIMLEMVAHYRRMGGEIPLQPYNKLASLVDQKKLDELLVGENASYALQLALDRFATDEYCFLFPGNMKPPSEHAKKSAQERYGKNNPDFNWGDLHIQNLSNLLPMLDYKLDMCFADFENISQLIGYGTVEKMAGTANVSIKDIVTNLIKKDQNDTAYWRLKTIANAIAADPERASIWAAIFPKTGFTQLPPDGLFIALTQDDANKYIPEIVNEFEKAIRELRVIDGGYGTSSALFMRALRLFDVDETHTQRLESARDIINKSQGWSVKKIAPEGDETVLITQKGYWHPKNNEFKCDYQYYAISSDGSQITRRGFQKMGERCKPEDYPDLKTSKAWVDATKHFSGTKQNIPIPQRAIINALGTKSEDIEVFLTDGFMYNYSADPETLTNAFKNVDKNTLAQWLSVIGTRNLPLLPIMENLPAEKADEIYYNNQNNERIESLACAYGIEPKNDGTESAGLVSLSIMLGLFNTDLENMKSQSSDSMQFILEHFIKKEVPAYNLYKLYGSPNFRNGFHKQFADMFMKHYPNNPELLNEALSRMDRGTLAQWLENAGEKPLPPLPILKKMPPEQAPTVYYKNRNNERMEALASQYGVKAYDEAEGLVALSNMLGLFNTEGGSMKSHSAKAMQYIIDHFIKKEVPALDLHKLYGSPDFTKKFNKKFADFFMYHYSVDPKLFTEVDTGVDMTMALLANFDKILEERPEKRIITRTDNKRLDPQEAIRMIQSANLNFDLLGDKKDDPRFQNMLRLISKFGASKEEVGWAVGLFERALEIDEEDIAIPNIDDKKAGLITFKSHLKSSPWPLVSGKRTNTCTKFGNTQKDRLERTVADPDWRYVTFESPNLSYFDGYTWYDKEQKMACIDNIEGLFNNADKRDKEAPALLFESIIRYSDDVFKKLKSMDIPCSKINLGTGHSAISEVFTQRKKDGVIKDDPNPSNYPLRNNITSDAKKQLTLTDNKLLGARRI